MIKTILFDLDGTLLPMDLEKFTNLYFHALSNKFTQLNFDVKKVMAALMSATKAMIENDGNETNELVFWRQFSLISEMKREECEPYFDQFYKNEFSDLKIYMEQSKNMINAVNLLVKKGYRLLLTTNPLFPKSAVCERVKWAGIDDGVFSNMTSYENSHYCKPNINYYKEVIVSNGLNVDECMMVGNDSLEDGVIETLGIPLYLVEDYLIHRSNDKLSSKWHGSSDDFYKFVEKLEYIKRK